jgi:hypothetical protein
MGYNLLQQVHNCDSHITDLCLKFVHPLWTEENLSVVRRCLEPSKCHFKTLTLLLPIPLPDAGKLETLRNFHSTFGLQKAFMGFSDGGFICFPIGEEDIKVLRDWVTIFEHDV